MSNKPTASLLHWATDALVQANALLFSAPISSKQDIGYQLKEKPSGANFNYIINNIFMWLAWVVERVFEFDNEDFIVSIGVPGTAAKVRMHAFSSSISITFNADYDSTSGDWIPDRTGEAFRILLSPLNTQSIFYQSAVVTASTPFSSWTNEWKYNSKAEGAISTIQHQKVHGSGGYSFMEWIGGSAGRVGRIVSGSYPSITYNAIPQGSTGWSRDSGSGSGEARRLLLQAGKWMAQVVSGSYSGTFSESDWRGEECVRVLSAANAQQGSGSGTEWDFAASGIHVGLKADSDGKYVCFPIQIPPGTKLTKIVVWGATTHADRPLTVEVLKSDVQPEITHNPIADRNSAPSSNSGSTVGVVAVTHEIFSRSASPSGTAETIAADRTYQIRCNADGSGAHNVFVFGAQIHYEQEHLVA